MKTAETLALLCPVDNAKTISIQLGLKIDRIKCFQTAANGSWL